MPYFKAQILIGHRTKFPNQLTVLCASKIAQARQETHVTLQIIFLWSLWSFSFHIIKKILDISFYQSRFPPILWVGFGCSEGFVISGDWTYADRHRFGLGWSEHEATQVSRSLGYVKTNDLLVWTLRSTYESFHALSILCEPGLCSFM